MSAHCGHARDGSRWKAIESLSLYHGLFDREGIDTLYLQLQNGSMSPTDLIFTLMESEQMRSMYLSVIGALARQCHSVPALVLPRCMPAPTRQPR
jgi:hypothetical protein